MESQVPEKVPCPYCGKLMRLVGRTATHARYICTGPLSADIRETAADELVGEVIAIVALATAAPPASDPRISHTPRHAPWPMTVLADAQGRPHQRPHEPGWAWSIHRCSAGGTVAALLFPVHLFLTGLAFPLGWLEAPRYEVLHRLVTHPLTRRYLFVLMSLPLFHWAHRFRYTLYDGLQMKHLTELIAVLCDGAALLGTAMTAYLLWTIA